MDNASKTLGNLEKVSFPAFNTTVDGKIDTGATTSSLHATDIAAKGGSVTFKCDLLSPNYITLDLHGTQEVHSADFGGDQRPVVQLDCEIAGVPLKGVMFNLNDRGKMDSKLLIGQDILKAGDFHVDVNKHGEAPPQQDAMPESVEKPKIDMDKVLAAVRILSESNITMADLVRLLQTEAISRIKE